MSATTTTPVRSVARVTTRQLLGGDAQVDAKALIIAPADPFLTDPFLLLAEDWFSEPGFDWHPHRGIETVTTVLDGVLEHGDSLGNAGALEPGDVQWMTAGRGIIHRELAFRDEHAHTLQLWLNLPARAKMTDTRYQDVLFADRPRVERPGVVVDVVSGDVAGVSARVRNHHPVHGAMVTLEPGASHDHALPADHRAFAHVIAGRLRVAGTPVGAGQTAWSDPAGAGPLDTVLPLVAADSDDPTVVMVYSGTPLREPIAMGGPFVMNHRSEIVQAFEDFHAGGFGEVPRQSRLRYR